MNEMLKLALTALRLGTMARRPWKAALLCFFLAIPCVFAAVVCAVAALWIWLVPQFGPVDAPLIVAAGFLVLAVILLLLGKWLMKPRRVSAETEALTAEIGSFVQNHKGVVLLLTALAGLVAGRDGRKE